ncbi:MAG: hypothetical protein ACXV3D_03000 [Halobacteriota archaeon]
MDQKELHDGLLKLGAYIPPSTLRRWASGGLIQPPIRYSKPRSRRVGRPEKRRGIEAKAKPGRFSYWPQESLEDAAAVWIMRNPFRPVKIKRKRGRPSKEAQESAQQDQFEEEEYGSDYERGRANVTEDAIKRALQQARDLRMLLLTDCKAAAGRFRRYLWPDGFSSQASDKGKILTFDNDRLYPLMVASIHAIEKARHHILLDMPVSIEYEWVIREDGLSAWKAMYLRRTYSEEIELNILHLRPCSNGYSLNYGFPHNETYMRDGFVASFLLRGNSLEERFSGQPLGPVPQDFYDEEKYAAYWDRDPYGWTDYAAGSHLL